MAACYLEPCRLLPFLSCTTTFLFWFLVSRLDCFGLPLVGALVVFTVLLDKHNPQDVTTSQGGVDLMSNMQLNLDAGTHFNYRRWKIGKPNVEGLGFFSWRLAADRRKDMQAYGVCRFRFAR